MRAAATLVTPGILLAVLSAVPARAQSAENVAVVINEMSAGSVRIGEHYVRTRNVPASNVIRIRTSADEEVPRVLFESTIERPIGRALSANSLQDRVLYIVLTKGVPLRIAGQTGLDGTVASVDSELTLLYRKMTGATVPTRGRVDNPFFLGARDINDAQRFTHRLQDIYLVSRLDAFTVDEAVMLIDRAQLAAADGQIVLDQRATADATVGDRWLDEAATRLRTLGFSDRVVLDSARSAARSIPAVLGYYSWGSNDVSNRVRSVDMAFKPGALAAMFVSTDARTLQPPPDDWVPSGDLESRARPFGGSRQSLIGDLIREGATGVAGQVAEPYLQSTIRPEILFPAYLSGFNLVEAFYLAMPHISWQTVVIGDPLCAVTVRKTFTPSGIEEPLDPETELPALFSKRRLATLHRGAPAASLAGLTQLLLSEARSAKNDPAGSKRALEEATRLSPSLIRAQIELAAIYEQSGEFTLADQRYRLILNDQPNNVVALNNLAYSLAVRHKTPAEAKPLAQRAVSLAVSDPTVIDTLAWIEHLLGDDEEASRLLSPAVLKSAVIADIHLHAAIVHQGLGNRAIAESQLKEALALDPMIADREDVKTLRAKLAEK